MSSPTTALWGSKTTSSEECRLHSRCSLLKGTISARSAKSKYRVNDDSLRYYKARLVKDGVAETIAVPRVAPALRTTLSTADDEKENGNITRERENYCEAYVRAGELMNKGVGKQKAAKQASGEFNVYISPSTALRAAERPGQKPIKRGRKLILGAAIEARLGMLCVVPREMRIPILQSMIMNFANTMIRGTQLWRRSSSAKRSAGTGTIPLARALQSSQDGQHPTARDHAGKVGDCEERARPLQPTRRHDGAAGLGCPQHRLRGGQGALGAHQDHQAGAHL